MTADAGAGSNIGFAIALRSQAAVAPDGQGVALSNLNAAASYAAPEVVGALKGQSHVCFAGSFTSQENHGLIAVRIRKSLRLMIVNGQIFDPDLHGQACFDLQAFANIICGTGNNERAGDGDLLGGVKVRRELSVAVCDLDRTCRVAVQDPDGALRNVKDIVIGDDYYGRVYGEAHGEAPGIHRGSVNGHGGRVGTGRQAGVGNHGEAVGAAGGNAIDAGLAYGKRVRVGAGKCHAQSAGGAGAGIAHCDGPGRLSAVAHISGVKGMGIAHIQTDAVDRSRIGGLCVPDLQIGMDVAVCILRGGSSERGSTRSAPPIIGGGQGRLFAQRIASGSLGDDMTAVDGDVAGIDAVAYAIITRRAAGDGDSAAVDGDITAHIFITVINALGIDAVAAAGDDQLAGAPALAVDGQVSHALDAAVDGQGAAVRQDQVDAAGDGDVAGDGDAALYHIPAVWPCGAAAGHIRGGFTGLCLAFHVQIGHAVCRQRRRGQQPCQQAGGQQDAP